MQVELEAARPAGQPVEMVAVDPGRLARAHAVRAEEPLFVVAHDDVGLVLAQLRHDLIGKPEIVDAVAKADQVVDAAHCGDGRAQALDVAMNVRNHPYDHRSLFPMGHRRQSDAV